MVTQRILVVDDHEPLLVAIRGVLESEGYTVLTATDGSRALRMMQEVHPDLIIADIMMPRMDGYTLYKEIRAQPEWVSIPFIFLTAKAEKEDRLKGKDLGAEDYLTKPFDPHELVIAVRSRLKRSRDIRKAEEVKFEHLKQQIVNVLGHELRTPLTYVRGYTELALEDIPSLSPAALQEFLLGIKRGADRLNRLVEDLMLLVQIDAGRAAEEFQLLVSVHNDLSSVLETAIQRYQNQALAKGVDLELEVEPDLPPVRLCEPYLLDAVGRLIENGIKFSQGDNQRVTVSARSTDDLVEISVADRGVGIAPENLPHIFKRFEQADRETMEQQGAGLGLALARELVSLHNGEITVESTLGEGSTFTIHLPVAAHHGS